MASPSSGRVEVVQLSIDARDYGVVGQARADGFGDVQGLVPAGTVCLAAIGQSDGKTLAHVVSDYQVAEGRAQAAAARG